MIKIEVEKIVWDWYMSDDVRLITLEQIELLIKKLKSLEGE